LALPTDARAAGVRTLGRLKKAANWEQNRGMITDARSEHAGAPRWSATLPYWVAVTVRPLASSRSGGLGIRRLLARVLRRFHPAA